MGAELSREQLAGMSTELERQAAARYVASRATDAVDCRNLLDALGLLGPSVERKRRHRKRASVPRTTPPDCPINTTTGGAP